MSPREKAGSESSLDAMRARLAAKHGPAYWRSLDELADSAEFKDYLSHEFPSQADTLEDPSSRRRFLQLMGASIALAGASACTNQPPEEIVPFARRPEDLIPGKPRYFATAMELGGYAHPVLVESHENRPTKIEGNPDHPSAGGSASSFATASILSLYDPDRSQVVLKGGRISSWPSFAEAMLLRIQAARVDAGAGLRILTRTVTSPTLAASLEAILAEFPEARWVQYEPSGGDPARRAARASFGGPVSTHYRLDRANVILALDADCLYEGAGAVRAARDFARGRRLAGGSTTMNRLYVVEATPTVTGASADHRLRLRASEVETFALALAIRLGVEASRPAPTLSADAEAWLGPLAEDLRAAGASALVIPGESQTAGVHALAWAINKALGALGSTLLVTEPVEARPTDQLSEMAQLVEEMASGSVETLLMLGGNPVYDAPADWSFAAALGKVEFRAHLSDFEDETSELCHWHVPCSHYLEAWGDVRARDGVVTIQQPLIAPLYPTKSALEMLSLFGEQERSGYEIVRSYWQERWPGGGGGFEKAWRKALHDGFVAGSEAALQEVSLTQNWSVVLSEPVAGDGIELVFRPDPTVGDGVFNNNGWMQELPKPLSKLTWDNAVLLSPATAERLGASNHDVVEVALGGRSLRGSVWILPGHVDESATLHLGYGRRRSGRVGTGAGFDASLVRTRDGFLFASGATISLTGERSLLATTQDHFSMEGRELVRIANATEYEQQPDFAQRVGQDPNQLVSLFGEPHKYDGYAWGMAIDLNACIGCNACTLACQSENNIPVVGKEQVLAGREMHWIRVDRYFEGSLDAPSVAHQPVTCMHCENAPCEIVCPVGATVHSSEGLNDMVYNRCVGTRYCSNNCPYKVRRFNFLLYSDFETPSLKLLNNPDVTVRSRGVMEKCTYCVQRINHARIESEKEGRKIRDGEITTACESACPTEAIVFGDINDSESRVSEAKASPRDYALLTELTTKPRTSYLAKVRNPNPALEAATQAEG